MKIHFGHRVGSTTPSTELPRDFCAGIGPLQLGVVLVSLLINQLMFTCTYNTHKRNNRIVHELRTALTFCDFYLCFVSIVCC